ncbi:LysR family transcriptional regulator [Caulobacter endophyticus]|uniref:LysR family transcriptional regulator n=1 Tax=Caulobacter endophyticus TaxID=2172652 RepID=A0A2T9JY05_9CAUL|nr:LysR family transcriptional regulator [Caulobacter endophyticus]PVM88587.1 LysR family transcriptional regulator [Caulobacter endophyticus]
MSMPAAETIDWEQQRAFLSVLREGSLSGAARMLGTAQPTVRRRIEDLERHLGVALFTRSPTGLTPTALARELAAPAEAMAAAAAAFARTASAEAGAAAGVVRITASEVIGMEVLPPILARISKAHPALVFELALTNLAEDLLRREADIAVRMIRPVQEALVAKRVGTIALGLHGHKDLLDAWGRPASLAEAKALPLVGFETPTAGVRAIKAASGVDLGPEDFAFRADSDLAQLAAIRAGLGVGFCQLGLAARDPSLERVVPDLAIGLETFVVTHEDLRDVRRIRIVFDALVEGLTTYARAGSPT